MAGRIPYYVPAWVGDDDTAFRTNRDCLGQRHNSGYVLGNIQSLKLRLEAIAVSILHANKENTSYFAVRSKRKKAVLHSPW